MLCASYHIARVLFMIHTHVRIGPRGHVAPWLAAPPWLVRIGPQGKVGRQAQPSWSRDAMAHSPIIKSSKWKPVRFLTQRCVLGGFISTPIKVDEETHPVTKQLFVRMRGTDKWMLKVLGSKLNGEQRHKKFLDMLHKTSKNATVVPHTDYGDGLDDKMTALDWEYDDVGEGDPPGTAQQQDEARSNKNAKQKSRRTAS